MKLQAMEFKKREEERMLRAKMQVHKLREVITC